MLTLYRRVKDGGKWKAEKIQEGRGRRTGDIKGLFFVRPFVAGVQKRHALHSTTFAEARKEADEIERMYEAQSRGLTVNELTTAENSHRIPIRSVVATYLEQKKNRRPKTLAQYRTALNGFLESLGKVRFLDEITPDVLRNHMHFLLDKGFAGKTVNTRMNIVTFLLKKNGVEARVPKDEMPTVEIEHAVAYDDADLDAMFKIMTPDETLLYKFFLGSAARDQEVTYAAWADVNWQKKTFTVRSKPEDGFVVKSHLSRTIRLPDTLVKMLEKHRKEAKSERWIFPDTNGQPGNHFLLKFKKIALRAGVNCGQCKTTVTKGEYDNKKKVAVTCATDPVCEHIKLHRLRKTCATRWHESGVPVRTIQHWLGHKSLETTMLYLGIADSEEVAAKVNEAFGD